MPAPDNDFIRFACECGKRLKSPQGTEGKAGACPKCGKAFKVPAVVQWSPGTPPPAPAQPQDDRTLFAIDDDPPAASAPTPAPGKPTKFCHYCGGSIAKPAEICPKCGVRQPQGRGPVKTVHKEPLARFVVGVFLFMLLLVGLKFALVLSMGALDEMSLRDTRLPEGWPQWDRVILTTKVRAYLACQFGIMACGPVGFLAWLGNLSRRLSWLGLVGVPVCVAALVVF